MSRRKGRDIDWVAWLQCGRPASAEAREREVSRLEGPLPHKEWLLVYRFGTLVSLSCVTQSCRNNDDGEN